MPEQGQTFHHDISQMIDDLNQPPYLTDAFSAEGVNPLIVLRNVFKADQSYLGQYLAKVLATNKLLYQDKSVLDLGCGCGIQGLICALHGAQEVHFSDVSPASTRNSRLNALFHNVRNVSFSTGNLFEAIPNEKKFDLIVFNPPSITGNPQTVAEAAFLREDSIITDFYDMYPDFLQPDGQVLMPGSSRFDTELSPRNMASRLSLPHRFIDQETESDANFKYAILIGKPNR